MTTAGRWAHSVFRALLRTKGSTMSEPGSDETPVLDLLANMTADSLEASDLDPRTLMAVRIAALVAVDAPPISYALNLEAAAATGVDADDVRGVLTAIAPIVGTARVASATAAIVDALAIELEVAMLQEEAAMLEEEERANKAAQ
jgi:alkylhydroperoxidase/carboxymuconolactone decarboxylase family protein YurZ